MGDRDKPRDEETQKRIRTILRLQPENPIPVPPADLAPLENPTLGDILCTCATSNGGAPWGQRAKATLGPSFDDYITAYCAGGDFYQPADPLPGSPPTPAGHTAGTSMFIFDATQTVVGIGGMNNDDFHARIPELEENTIDYTFA